ncbi:efflux transporter, RND family, MFP subunit [Parvibaculum lavamentivorans DS-1]|uniref:Efflux transporter, RND family, MFP subunit n=1 Tax=Parvibaculum lavamentivorans (strain DS-1 / DSM 13023 / NCIMB 13966) TaxID=402881 RepID=A7HW59_PARL1|nr:efflux RND transporter periplasmic adaptor subunit [Parvibaculum lavamentivorans]ABS64142.1 efflux transporter, RND family, MFP subunit [Parvibaculum lavamentivorans DS-1]
MTKRMIWTGGAVVLAVLVVAGAFFLFLRAPAAVVVTPFRGMAVEAVYATGTVEPVNYARVGAKISGRITNVLKREGEPVEKGNILAIIELGEDISRVHELEARLKLANADLDRARTLRRSGNVSEAALDQAQSAQSATAAALRGAKARLDDHFITAPMAGTVLRSESQIRVGDMAQPGHVLFMVGDTAELQIDAEVDEEDITKVAPEQEALIRADAFPGRALKGTVKRITPYGDPVGRTYRVYISLPADTPLISGMTTEINIVVRREEEALLVPVSALSGNSVWTVSGGRARRVEVELGAVGSDTAEILSGLPEDALVIANPSSGIAEGDRVRAEQAAPDGTS